MSSSGSIPQTSKAWTVGGQNGFDSLKFHKDAPVPKPSDYEVLVKFHAASLNYRDLIIPKGEQGIVDSLISPAPANPNDKLFANGLQGNIPSRRRTV
jgi:NADPH:quinone reductase-like Zn-dependent oxidoreductase